MNLHFIHSADVIGHHGAVVSADSRPDSRPSGDSSGRDRALTVVASYLRECGIHHPDVVRDQCHRLVDSAKDRFGLTTQNGVDHGDPFRLSKLSLELAVESLSDRQHGGTTGGRRQVIPTIQQRPLSRNATPSLLGPLRADWWWTLAGRAAAGPARLVSGLRNGLRRRFRISEILSDGQ